MHLHTKSRGKINIYFSFCLQYIPNFYKILRDQKDEEAKDTFKKAVQKLDEELKARGKYFGGNS